MIFRRLGPPLLIKLALLDRAGTDATGLLQQKAVLEPIASAISLEQPQPQGFDATLLAWRRAMAAAALSFLDDITPLQCQPGHDLCFISTPRPAWLAWKRVFSCVRPTACHGAG